MFEQLSKLCRDSAYFKSYAVASLIVFKDSMQVRCDCLCSRSRGLPFHVDFKSLPLMLVISSTSRPYSGRTKLLIFCSSLNVFTYLCRSKGSRRHVCSRAPESQRFVSHSLNRCSPFSFPGHPDCSGTGKEASPRIPGQGPPGQQGARGRVSALSKA